MQWYTASICNVHIQVPTAAKCPQISCGKFSKLMLIFSWSDWYTLNTTDMHCQENHYKDTNTVKTQNAMFIHVWFCFANGAWFEASLFINRHKIRHNVFISLIIWMFLPRVPQQPAWNLVHEISANYIHRSTARFSGDHALFEGAWFPEGSTVWIYRESRCQRADQPQPQMAIIMKRPLDSAHSTRVSVIYIYI